MPSVTIKNFLLCESVRQETGGKMSILGVYGLGEGIRFGVFDVTQPVENLLFVLFLDGDPGTYQLTATITDPNDKVVFQSDMNNVTIKKAGRPVAGLQLNKTAFGVTGKFTLNVAQKLASKSKNIFNTWFMVDDPSTMPPPTD